MKLDLTSLSVESFEPSVIGGPMQWMMAPPETDDTMNECCPDDVHAATAYFTCMCPDR